MPIFFPPLAHSSEISIPSTDGQFAHLTFRVSFSPQEDTSGSWEIWTDLPGLQYGQGWHEYSFKPVKPNATVQSTSSEDDDSTPTIHITSSKEVHQAPEEQCTWICSITIPAASATYSYTFRRVFQDGHIDWLGSGGSNGQVIMVPTDHFNLGMVDKQDLDQTINWKGFAVNGTSQPHLELLPRAQPTLAEYLYLHTKSPLAIPFATITSDPSDTSPTLSTLCLTSLTDSCIQIPAHSLFPEDMAQVQVERWDRLKAPAMSSMGGSIIDLEVQDGENTVAFLNQSTSPASMELYSSSEQSTLASITLPSSLIKDGPHLLTHEDGLTTFIPCGSAGLRLRIQAGAVVSVLKFHQFTELKGGDKNHSFRLVCPSSVGVEFGKEEIEQPLRSPIFVADGVLEDCIDAKKTETPEPIISNDADGNDEHYDSETQETVSTVVEDHAVDEEEEEEEEQTEELEEEEVEEEELEAEAKGWSFLGYLSHLLLAFWDFISQAFVSKKAVITGDEEPVGEEVERPSTPDERTPLLSSPALSRATSATAFSPFINDDQAVVKAPGIAKVISVDSGNENSVETSMNQPLIRSYASFTLAAGPATFFVPPNVDVQQLLQAVQFRRKEKNEGQWTHVEASILEATADGCSRLELDSAGAQEWQVKITVL